MDTDGAKVLWDKLIEQLLLDLRTILAPFQLAKSQFKENGRGFLVMEFKTLKDFEKWTKAPSIVWDLMYVPLSVERGNNEILRTGHEMAREYDPTKELVLCVVVLNTYDDNGNWQVLRVAY